MIGLTGTTLADQFLNTRGVKVTIDNGNKQLRIECTPTTQTFAITD